MLIEVSLLSNGYPVSMKRRETTMVLTTDRHARAQFGIVRAGQHVWRVLGLCFERHRQRDDLAELDDHLLADIGVTRDAAERECAKPFWR